MSPAPSNAYFSPALSILFVYVLPLVLAGGPALRFFLRSLLAARRARDARRAADAESDTLDEGDTILRGRVELDDPQGAVRVTIEQTGTEAESSGSWTVTWTEKHRRTFVAPFYVVHASGQRVRVEPGPKTDLAAELVTTERVDATHRRRIAEIAQDEEVWIVGELAKGFDPRGEGGYRGSSTWVMRPARDGRMRVSSDLPEAAFMRRARTARVWSVLFTLVLVLMLGTHLQYHALFGEGRRVTATIVQKVVVHGDENDSYVLRFAVKEGSSSTLYDEIAVSGPTFDAWEEGNTFAAFAAFGSFANAEPGDGARALVAPTVVTSCVWVSIVLASIMKRPRKWHEGARVDESHAGRLST